MSNRFEWVTRTTKYLQDLSDELDRLFDSPEPYLPDLGVMVKKGHDSVTLNLDVPGMALEDLSLVLKTSTLTLYQVKDGAPVRILRRIRVSSDVAPQDIKATVKHGLLTLVITRCPESQSTTQTIPIQQG